MVDMGSAQICWAWWVRFKIDRVFHFPDNFDPTLGYPGEGPSSSHLGVFCGPRDLVDSRDQRRDLTVDALNLELMKVENLKKPTLVKRPQETKLLSSELPRSEALA